MLNVSPEGCANAEFKEAWSYVDAEKQIKLKYVYRIAHALMEV